MNDERETEQDQDERAEDIMMVRKTLDLWCHACGFKPGVLIRKEQASQALNMACNSVGSLIVTLTKSFEDALELQSAAEHATRQLIIQAHRNGKLPERE